MQCSRRRGTVSLESQAPAARHGGLGPEQSFVTGWPTAIGLYLSADRRSLQWQYLHQNSIAMSRWSVTAGAHYAAAMRTVAGQGALREDQSTDAFAVLNVSAEYRVRPWSSLYLTVQNLAGESYVVARQPAGARPGLPRTILGRLRIRR